MIRYAKVGDAEQMAHLMHDLGYPSTTNQMKDRLQTIGKKEDYQTFVWEEDEELLGMVGVIFNVAYHTDDPHGRVIAFVVREDRQGNGIGRKLMEEAESWGKEKGAKIMMLNSGNREERAKTHAIYQYYGFIGKATGFYKNL